MRRPTIAIVTGCAFLLGAGALVASRTGAQAEGSVSAGTTRDALQRAEADRQAARLRAETLERQAAQADEAAQQAAGERAALAARIQQAEAAITSAEVRVALIQDQQAALDLRLAERREPLLGLTAALQRMARRPLALSALKPGSLKDAVYLRAMLATTVPRIREQTADLRAELDRSRELAIGVRQALSGLRDTERTLAERRAQLAAAEARHRLASRQAAQAARREEERVFALAEEARNLDGLIAELDRAGSLRERLAALPGPVLRPGSGGSGPVRVPMARAEQQSTQAPRGYRLPVAGRVASGFGERSDAGSRQRAMELVPRPGALVVAPAAGRIAFAGAYRGYGRIVIIEHGNGWTSVLTGLGRTDAAVGETVMGGAPLGRAAMDRPSISLELRKDGRPINPLRLVG